MVARAIRRKEALCGRAEREPLLLEIVAPLEVVAELSTRIGKLARRSGGPRVEKAENLVAPERPAIEMIREDGRA